MVINEKVRFATEGFRAQRHNPDGTIPTPSRFLGFANTADLSKALISGSAPLTIKIDSKPPETKTVSFDGDVTEVTVNDAVNALNNAGFTGIVFSFDGKTGRLKGSAEGTQGKKAVLKILVTNKSDDDGTIPVGMLQLATGGTVFKCHVESPIIVAAGESSLLAFIAETEGAVTLPADEADVTNLISELPDDFTAEVESSVQGAAAVGIVGEKIQVTGKLAAALDFGQGIKHGGNGLEIISKFDDQTISIGLPKDIKDKEEIDQEGAKGTINRMIIGSMLQGMSPVITLRHKDYFLLEMIQGGNLNRENGTYDPPSSRDSDHPSFYTEVFSAVYNEGNSSMSKVAGYEKLLLRYMIGTEGDVPIEAKSWATYAFNTSATEYTDENGETLPAYQEQTLSMTQFDALKVKEISIKG